MTHGGRRKGAGRPLGSGKFGEPTQPIRVPVSIAKDVARYVQHSFYRVPLFVHTVSAGFPIPADDECHEKLDLNELLIRHPSATFFLRVSGNSMIGAGIHHNDVLIVDRSLEPKHGKIIIASLNGELTVKRLIYTENAVCLHAENEEYQPIMINSETDFRIWGVVTTVIHSV